MTPDEIYGRLRTKGIFGKDIARELGVSIDLVSKTIRGERRSALVRECIAEMLGQPQDAIWPPDTEQAA